MTDILGKSMCLSSYKGIVGRRQIDTQSAVKMACQTRCDIAKELLSKHRLRQILTALCFIVSFLFVVNHSDVVLYQFVDCA